ncbi:MAG TPA: PIG-L deacetylase family protein [Ornithinicoccus sp.]|jgi:LmbE family N-acetylglucosaminyl deacetylase|nr:PIG-L deacetylase family protein [Ornithinicoccus sp.]
MELAPFPEDWTTALCVAAHPDDLEYGTAAAVARWTGQGKTVTYALATRGEAGIDTMTPDEAAPVREQEERDGARRVGVDVVEFLGLRDGTVEFGLPLRRAIAAEIRRRRPEVVLTLTPEVSFPNGMLNQADHRAVGLATLDACADAGNRWIFPELTEQGLEPWSGVRWIAVVASAHPTHEVDVTENFEDGVASLEAHAQYNAALGPDFPTPRQIMEMVLADPERPGVYRLAVQLFGRG